MKIFTFIAAFPRANSFICKPLKYLIFVRFLECLAAEPSGAASNIFFAINEKKTVYGTKKMRH